MIATHNIKVNGRWFHAGEEIVKDVPETPAMVEEAVAEPEVPVEKEPEKAAETKPRTTTRRKKISE